VRPDHSRSFPLSFFFLREESNVAVVEPVTLVRNGKRGRPRKVLNRQFVAEAMSSHRKITITELAKLMKISRPTLIKHLKENGVYYKFTDLSKSELDALVKSFRTAKPDSGLRYLIGHLRRHGLRVQKRRVYSSIRRVDGLGQILRQRHVIKRQDYKVARPHAVWHVDGHHKLILWGIVIHGFVDGYSRTVTILPLLLKYTLNLFRLLHCVPAPTTRLLPCSRFFWRLSESMDCPREYAGIVELRTRKFRST
jgi:hypothetical protein